MCIGTRNNVFAMLALSWCVHQPPRLAPEMVRVNPMTTDHWDLRASSYQCEILHVSVGLLFGEIPNERYEE